MEVLLEEVEALRTIKKDDSAPAHQQDLQEAQLALQEIAQRCERLQQALEFYGALDNYRPPKPAPGETPPLWIGNDLGRRAREALGVPEISSIPETDDIN